MSPDASIRTAVAEDGAALARIYNHYIANTIVTFEEAAVSAADMSARVAEISAAQLPWLVAQSSAGVSGFAYASRWKGRCAYRYSVESTVYLDPGCRRPGTGHGVVLAAVGSASGTGLPCRHRRHRIAQRGQCRAARETRHAKGCALRRGGIQVRPLGRCGLLAASIPELVRHRPSARSQQARGGLFRGASNWPPPKRACAATPARDARRPRWRRPGASPV